MEKMTFIDAALYVLQEVGCAMHYKDIMECITQRQLVQTAHQDPKRALYTALAYEMKKPTSRIHRLSPGVFDLIEHQETPKERVRVAHYPTYQQTREFLRIVAGWALNDVATMRADIKQKTGNPQQTIDWTDPDQWIDQRLEASSAQLAHALWEQSKGVVNPRYTVGLWGLCRRYELLTVDEQTQCLMISEEGQDFLDHRLGTMVREIDDVEGLLFLLEQVADHDQCSSGELFDDWMSYLSTHSNIRSDNAGRSYLSARLKNLEQRGLLERAGRQFSVTESGINYFGVEESSQPTTPSSDFVQQIRRLRHQQDELVRSQLRSFLSEMPWQDFEHLIAHLLEAMGYENVMVTSPSNDKGVDVVADIELGITAIKEVIQVKRQQANVQRPILDALRGSLYRFHAVRATIITLGGFSNGAQQTAFDIGAAPITLIDGEKLMDLLIEHGIGVQRREISFLEFSSERLLHKADDDELI